MPNAIRLPSGNYRVRVVSPRDAAGRREVKSFTAPTAAEAQRLAAEYVAGLSSRVRPGSGTFGQAARQYIDDRERILSPATLRAYEGMLRSNLQSIVPIQLHRLTNHDLQRLANRLAADHSPKTVRNVLAFATAVLSEYAPDLKISIDLPRRNPTRVEIPSDDQIRQLLLTDNQDLRTAIVLASSLGLRRGELCALTWADLDIANKRLTVNKAFVVNDSVEWILKAPKTPTSNRTLSVPDGCMDYLLSIRPDPCDPAARLIRSNPNSVTDAFIRRRNACGLTCRLHDLRHYYASVMLALGVPDKYAMARMGHATPNMLHTVYQHLIDSKNAEIDAQLNTRMTAALNPSPASPGDTNGDTPDAER